jgi:magnesium chelatase subunit I
MSAPEPATATASTPPPTVATLGELRASGWRSVPVAAELRRNAAARIATGQPLVAGVLGFEDTVLPQLEHAVLAGHDIILLGERGQAKTRLVRSLVDLLDEWLPVVAGSEIHDDPTNPISRYAKDLVAERGDDTPVAWVHRSDRYGEKLATPDTSIADLIGEVDPIRVAEGRYLSDELTIHYGLVPRLNRGIFAVNELPDLAERIQVGLLNVLEERDVQIRGHRVRLPLDIVLVATANPEDYTNRGRIITPLKDRFGAQIRTHYPPDTETELAIARQEADLPGSAGGSADGTAGPADDGLPRVVVPDFMAEVVAELSQLARESPHLNQRSGVSVRLTVANYETMVASALRRSLRTGDADAVPRISDLQALVASTQGKVEVETLEEGREELLIGQLVSAAVVTVFRRRVRMANPQGVVGAFTEETVVHAGDDLPSGAYLDTLERLPALAEPVFALAGGTEEPGVVASACELVLEGLHLTKRLNKEAVGLRATYRGRG